MRILPTICVHMWTVLRVSAHPSAGSAGQTEASCLSRWVIGRLRGTVALAPALCACAIRVGAPHATRCCPVSLPVRLDARRSPGLRYARSDAADDVGHGAP